MSICRKCVFWGDGTGKGCGNYDAGAVNYCEHKLIAGHQACSSSAYDDDEISKVIVDSPNVSVQRILTRWNFGCNLHKSAFDLIKEA